MLVGKLTPIPRTVSIGGVAMIYQQNKQCAHIPCRCHVPHGQAAAKRIVMRGAKM
jgi:hypothetical protein